MNAPHQPGQPMAWVWVNKPAVYVVPLLGSAALPSRWITAIEARQGELRCLGTRPSGVACRRVVHQWHLWFRTEPPFSGYCATHRPDPDEVWQGWGASQMVPCPCGCEAQVQVFGRALAPQDAPIQPTFQQIIQTIGPDQWRTRESSWTVMGTSDTDGLWTPGIVMSWPISAGSYRDWLFDGPRAFWEIDDSADF